ncbi:MAG: CPBP family intramembrane metalloprotease [Bacteroidetes bacterium]|nr:CPBP family intramembrane metalloprotease [Bacteroidota bacterium]
MVSADELLTMSGNELPSVLILGLFTLSFLAYWKIFSSSQGDTKKILKARVAGAVLLGIIPTSVFLICTEYSFSDIGYIFVKGSGLFILTASIVLSLLAVVLNVFTTRNPNNLKNYPQIREKIWGRRLLLLNAATWIIYLIAYEMLFRGLLLFPLIDVMGIWPAVLVNVSLYSATHIPKGMNEAVGAVFLGTILCVLTILSGSIWIAVFVHIALGLSNSFLSLHNQKDMRIALKGKN